MTCSIGEFDIETYLGHNVHTKTVGNDTLYIRGRYTRGEGGALDFAQSLTDRFQYAGRYARHIIPGASADAIQDMSPDSSVYKYVSAGTGAGNFVSGWYAVDGFNYNLMAGRPHELEFQVRLTKVRNP